MKKILVIRFSSIGDIVLTTPVIRCLKQQIPGCELHVLTKEKYAGLYHSNTYIDHVHELGNSLHDIIKELKKENFDHVVDLQRNVRSLKVRLALHRPSSTFNKLDFKKFLLTTFHINRLPKVHIVDRCFEAVAPLGVINDGLGLDFFISEANLMSESDIPKEFRNGFYAFSIGGSYPTKVMPNELIIDIIRRLDEPVILLGGYSDMANADIIAREFDSTVGNSVGKLNLEQSAAIIKMSKKVFTGDTGMMHIAAAFHKPIVSVWGNTVPEFGMTPYVPDDPTASQIFEVHDLPCRPCSKLGYKRCPKGHFNCMYQQDIAAIVKALKS